MCIPLNRAADSQYTGEGAGGVHTNGYNCQYELLDLLEKQREVSLLETLGTCSPTRTGDVCTTRAKVLMRSGNLMWPHWSSLKPSSLAQLVMLNCNLLQPQLHA